jgi:hypothetical protein
MVRSDNSSSSARALCLFKAHDYRRRVLNFSTPRRMPPGSPAHARSQLLAAGRWESTRNAHVSTGDRTCSSPDMPAASW